MFRAFVRLAVMSGVAAFAMPALACFPKPGAMPIHEISVVALPPHAVGISVVLESEGYALRVTADDLLSELSKSQWAIAKPKDLENALRSKMALGEDIDTPALVAVLTSDPGATASNEAKNQHRITTNRANQTLRYAFATLLQQGKASVTEIASRRQLAELKLDRFTDICDRGRLFTTGEDKQILRVIDAIS